MGQEELKKMEWVGRIKEDGMGQEGLKKIA